MQRSTEERDLNKEIIFNWRIEASRDGENFTILFVALNPTYLGYMVQDFLIDTPDGYSYSGDFSA